MTKLLLALTAILLTLHASAQDDRTNKIYRENAAADERRLQQLKEDGSKPNSSSTSGSGLSKEYWMEQQAAGDKARAAYSKAAARVKADYANDDRPVYDRHEHIPGKPDDYVEITYANGALYWGGWKNYKYHGKGKLVSSNGDIYDGDWVKDKREGTGTQYTVEDHSWYTGGFKNNKRHGQGRLKHNNREYVGEFKRDKETGHGVRTDGDGWVHDGIWDDGYMNGDFTWTKNGVLRFTGHYTNRGKDGECMYVYENGSVFTGTYKNDVIVGVGKMVMPNGDVYVGTFKNDIFHGKGKLTLKNGTVQEGNWAEGKFID